MLQAPNQDQLAATLIKVVSDPMKVRDLHEILGGFCHQCRNSLNTIKLSLYLTRRAAQEPAGLDWNHLDERYRDVETIFDRLHTLCRPMTLNVIRAPLGLIFEDRGPTWQSAMAARDRRLTLVSNSEHDVGEFDPIRLSQGLDSFVLWRSKLGDPGQPATLCWEIRESRFAVDWHEPGVPYQPDSHRSDSLALPLLARVVAAHGGAVALDHRHGFHLGASWPLTVRTTP